MKRIFLFILSVITVFMVLGGCAQGRVDDPLRLHVIANSDSEKDQEVKLMVRDGILEYTANNSGDFTSKEAVESYVENHMEDLTAMTDGILKKEGFNYTSHIEMGRFYFPEKTYGDVTYKAGYYDGVKVVLGAGEGKNWWCVIFPPLCLISVSDTNSDISGIKKDKIVYKSIFDA